MSALRVLVTGSRAWTNVHQLQTVLNATLGFAEAVEGKLHITHGNCPSGADALTDQWITQARWGTEGHDVAVTRVRAQWGLHPGKSAGYVRNREMVALGHDLCLAFLSDPANSPGTNHCAGQAQIAGIPVYVILEEK